MARACSLGVDRRAPARSNARSSGSGWRRRDRCAGVQWSWLRVPLERRMSASIGREVTIDELNGRWEQGPRLQLRGVTVDGSDAATPLLKAREVSLHVSPWPLLVGRIELIELGLTGAVIDLQRNAEGRGNWPGAITAAAERRDGWAAPPRWQTTVVEAVTLKDVVLSVRDAVTDLEVRARADSMQESPEATAWTTRYELTGQSSEDAIFRSGLFRDARHIARHEHAVSIQGSRGNRPNRPRRRGRALRPARQDDDRHTPRGRGPEPVDALSDDSIGAALDATLSAAGQTAAARKSLPVR